MAFRPAIQKVTPSGSGRSLRRDLRASTAEGSLAPSQVDAMFALEAKRLGLALVTPQAARFHRMIMGAEIPALDAMKRQAYSKPS